MAGVSSEHMGEVRSVSDSEYENSIKDSEWVLVDFWAPWCGPCKALAPVLEQVASEREILIAKVDTDSNPANAGKLGVRGIPALFLYHNGSLVGKQSGAMPKPALLNWIDQHMTADDF
ncbi:MAG: thioredoxin [Candidatus Thermoplasmatota archaeon]|nr:thioredoxin [Candidatus Thermoplasmatota archaeon]MEC8540429.1 thioredoxin [Candidatus Thermoplasmatota archaeon]